MSDITYGTARMLGHDHGIAKLEAWSEGKLLVGRSRCKRMDGSIMISGLELNLRHNLRHQRLGFGKSDARSWVTTEVIRNGNTCSFQLEHKSGGASASAPELEGHLPKQAGIQFFTWKFLKRILAAGEGALFF